MAGSPIATLFARLGFNVDEKGLKRFQSHLQTLKRDVNSIGNLQRGLGKSLVTSHRQVDSTVKNTVRQYGKLKDQIDKVVATSQGMPQGKGFKQPVVKPIFKDSVFTPTSAELGINTGNFERSVQGARNAVDNLGQSQSQTTNRINRNLRSTSVGYNNLSRSGINGAAKATQNLTKDTEKLQSRLDGILRSYGKVPVSLDRARKDMQSVRGMFSDGAIDRKQLASAQSRIQQRIDTLVQADNKRTQRVLGNISKEQQGLKRIRNDYAEINREYRRGNVSYERRAELLGGLRQEYRRQQQSIKPEHKRANLLEQIEKRYDRHGKQLRQIRRDFSYVNTQYKSGNISLERRNELLGDQYRRYRDIQRMERRQRATGSRVGRAGGIYAGGADPRQVGNHR